ncbi:hypothetical protein [Burkholderia glumae]|uniref:hypothetical protein n=1 Tax=Burkholderia glumae TaxID=337 RepID=UPI002150DEA3|nr:hypothetical protein [Burkholderia glumae]
MMARSALSTPSPLPHVRENRRHRAAMTPASVDSPAIAANKRGHSPAKAIQNDETPLTRHTSVQTNETPVLLHQGMTTRIEALRSKIRSLVAEITHAADVALLDLIADKAGCYVHYQAVREARDWAATAGITLETGLMQLGHALQQREADSTIHGSELK